MHEHGSGTAEESRDVSSDGVPRQRPWIVRLPRAAALPAWQSPLDFTHTILQSIRKEASHGNDIGTECGDAEGSA